MQTPRAQASIQSLPFHPQAQPYTLSMFCTITAIVSSTFRCTAATLLMDSGLVFRYSWGRVGRRRRGAKGGEAGPQQCHSRSTASPTSNRVCCRRLAACNPGPKPALEAQCVEQC